MSEYEAKTVNFHYLSNLADFGVELDFYEFLTVILVIN